MIFITMELMAVKLQSKQQKTNIQNHNFVNENKN